MSIKVELNELPNELERYGNAAFVLTSSGEGRPHIIQLLVRLDDGKFFARPGRSCSRNVLQRPELSLLWPAFEPGAYSLIVDGVGEITGEGDSLRIVITPSNAVLHRPAQHEG